MTQKWKKYHMNWNIRIYYRIPEENCRCRDLVWDVILRLPSTPRRTNESVERTRNNDLQFGCLWKTRLKNSKRSLPMQMLRSNRRHHKYHNRSSILAMSQTQTVNNEWWAQPFCQEEINREERVLYGSNLRLFLGPCW